MAPWPSFGEEEIRAVGDVLRSGRVNYWTGEHCREFETEFAAWAGVSHAVALANGTVALDLALKGLGIGPGDEVVVTPRTFIASISCVVNAGARPVFADVDRDSGNITAQTIEPRLTERTRAIIPVHLGGWPCDMGPIMDLARGRGIRVIEDCAQAHGAYWAGRSVGSIGDAGAWSFCQDKIMTTGGEGGMVTTDDAELWSRMWSFKDHGKSWEAVYERQHPPGFRWVHETFGTNWRMLEMQAVIGRLQLKQMADWTRARTAAAGRYAEVAAGFQGALRVPLPRADDVHAYYRFYAYVKPDGLRSGWSRDRIIAEVNARGVPLMQGSCSEVYREKAFDNTGWAPAQRLPAALELGETSLMFLTHPTLTDDDLSRICDTFASVMREAAA
ncbi:MAG TPA: DegT/DnrJ/EryC1/StrS aminotransferase family protein [Croceibacterium sp.]|nr:DegT/DnrJ/EryC1/StrS aminotransferase family protein [Croceibacterium sp.]